MITEWACWSRNNSCAWFTLSPFHIPLEVRIYDKETSVPACMFFWLPGHIRQLTARLGQEPRVHQGGVVESRLVCFRGILLYTGPTKASCTEFAESRSMVHASTS